MYIKPCPEKIRAARRKQGLSAYALAMKAGLDKKAIYRIESKESLRTHSLRAQAMTALPDMLFARTTMYAGQPRWMT